MDSFQPPIAFSSCGGRYRRTRAVFRKPAGYPRAPPSTPSSPCKFGNLGVGNRNLSFFFGEDCALGGLELGEIWSFTRDVCVCAAEAADHVRVKQTMAIGMLKTSTKTFTVCVCVARLILKC